MRVCKKIKFFLISSLLMFLLTGCLVPQEPMEIITPSGSPEGKAQQASMSKRFQESGQQGSTVIESAMELSKKYAKLSEEASALKEKNQGLDAENNHLKEKLAACESQLQQAQKELAQANDLLVEMRIELNNWKNNILGFRNEMRDAEKTQLEALLKILTVLGGEVKTESIQGVDANSSSESESPSGSPKSQKISGSGEKK